MRLFAYYALHTFKNQLKKLFKTWVSIFIAVCLFAGLGVFFAALDDPGQGAEADPPGTSEPEEPSFSETAGIGTGEAVELIAGGVVLLMFAFYAVGADKNGSRIFLPADVELLFPSPMKPQSVLIFRVATQLGVAVFGCVYMLFQLPNLVLNMGIGIWAALALIVAWGITTVFGTLIQVLLYTLSSAHTSIKRFLRPAVYGSLLLTAVGFVLFSVRSGVGYLRSAALFFNVPVTRYIPVWGWIKGFCAFAVEGDIRGAALCLFALALAGAALVYWILSIPADFYEDAMAKSEETAELLEKARSEKSGGVVLKRERDRSEKILRDGMRHGAGANVFFFKSLYNRRRFAHLGLFTKTMETYLAAAAGVSLICRFVTHTRSVMPVALTLAALAFFRSLGNPLEKDASMDSFLLIPESTTAKLFWSLMGGTANCLLDVLPAVIAGALFTGSNIFASLAWVPFIVSVDFYATNVGAFIWSSAPVSAGKTVKQMVQVMFVYFGLLPDIVIAAIGITSGHTAAAVVCAAGLNFALGLLFFLLSPIFLGNR